MLHGVCWFRLATKKARLGETPIPNTGAARQRGEWSGPGIDGTPLSAIVTGFPPNPSTKTEELKTAPRNGRRGRKAKRGNGERHTERTGRKGMLQREFNYRSLMVKDESGDTLTNHPTPRPYQPARPRRVDRAESGVGAGYPGKASGLSASRLAEAGCAKRFKFAAIIRCALEAVVGSETGGVSLPRKPQCLSR